MSESILWTVLGSELAWRMIIASFLIGSIPMGYLVSIVMAKKNPLQHGSHSTGATNVARVAGKKAGVLVFALDFLKGFLPPMGIWIFFGFHSPEVAYLAALCGFAASLGHCFSPFLGFHGGKGVSTSLGALLHFIPLFQTVIPSLLVFALVYKTSKTVSFASLSGLSAAFLLSLLGELPQPGWGLLIALSALVIIRHRDNLNRILENRELHFR